MLFSCLGLCSVERRNVIAFVAYFCFPDSAGRSLFSSQPVSQPSCGSFIAYPGLQPTPPDSRSPSPLPVDERLGEFFMVSKNSKWIYLPLWDRNSLFVRLPRQELTFEYLLTLRLSALHFVWKRTWLLSWENFVLLIGPMIPRIHRFNCRWNAQNVDGQLNLYSWSLLYPVVSRLAVCSETSLLDWGSSAQVKWLKMHNYRQSL